MAIHLQNNGDFFELFFDFGTARCSRATFPYEDAVELSKRLRQELDNVFARDEAEDERMVSTGKTNKILSAAQFKHDILKNTITDEAMPTSEIHVIGADGKKVIIKF